MEDCLYLNVYAPLRGRHHRPVLFWVHGGAYQGGGGNETRLNGTWDVALTKGELVVVTSNYRLNVFGFAASELLRSRDAEGSTGNYGIQDQRMALQWVQENIRAFRGDPRRVLLVGQSAGAESAGEESARAAEEQSAVRAAAAGCLFTMREALDASPRRAAEGVLLRVCCLCC